MNERTNTVGAKSGMSRDKTFRRIKEPSHPLQDGAIMSGETSVSCIMEPLQRQEPSRWRDKSSAKGITVKKDWGIEVSNDS